ncbi:MAG TPA: Bax inhibitor-1/YccA family protein [Thermoanaerobaculia bacterium]|nr:Bax inhibitor-1/YccA family protein [Thermoanaerobaculia bacterium]
MNPFEVTPDARFQSAAAAGSRVSIFLRRVYGWMFAGLALTGLVAVGMAGNPSLVIGFARNPILFFGLMIGELGLVVYLSARVLKMSPAAAIGAFVAYAALNGVLFSTIFLVYSATSIATTFFITAGMFGALAFFGTVTKRSLAGVGSFVSMGLIGLLLAMVVGFFVHSDGLQFAISIIGVIVFTGLTAWDAQRLKGMALATPEGNAGNIAILGALRLYLDFVNLFLFLLRFMGRRR